MNPYLITLFCIGIAIPLFIVFDMLVKHIRIEKGQSMVIVAFIIATVAYYTHNPTLALSVVFLLGVAVIRMYFD